MRLEIAGASEPKFGETANGDDIVVRSEAAPGAPSAPGIVAHFHGDSASAGRILITLVDALGHGPRGADVARRASAYLREIPLSQASVAAVMMGLHERLQGTRGAAAMVCLVEVDQIEGASVGNVDLRATLSRPPLVLTQGILGARMRPLRVFGARLLAGDRLVMFSDGIQSNFPIPPRVLPTREACREVLNGYRRDHDDASVVVMDTET